eukprot:SAG31_NODE_1094_length_9945_cov_3.834349_12_plen_86_part_00
MIVDRMPSVADPTIVERCGPLGWKTGQVAYADVSLVNIYFDTINDALQDWVWRAMQLRRVHRVSLWVDKQLEVSPLLVQHVGTTP